MTYNFPTRSRTLRSHRLAATARAWVDFMVQPLLSLQMQQISRHPTMFCQHQWINTSATPMTFCMKTSTAVPDSNPTRPDLNMICLVGSHHDIVCQILPWPFIIRTATTKSCWGKKPTQRRFNWKFKYFKFQSSLLIRRRGTGSNLPMAMKYRTLKETYKKSVGVYRSHIHGRGLFCTRDIEAGELHCCNYLRNTLT